MLTQYLKNLIEKSAKVNIDNIISLIDVDSNAKILDLGCDDGEKTCLFGKKSSSNRLYGVELVSKRVELAIENGVDAIVGDLNKELAYKDNSFDVVVSNQVIEHLDDTDIFVSEIFRVLKPGGYAIVSSENLASWHNIFALILGFQPFSTANYSSLGSLGNPLSLWRNESISDGAPNKQDSWLHKRMFSYLGFIELFELHGFKVERISMAGYYPFPDFFLSKIDKRHSHYMTMKIRKFDEQ